MTTAQSVPPALRQYRAGVFRSPGAPATNPAVGVGKVPRPKGFRPIDRPLSAVVEFSLLHRPQRRSAGSPDFAGFFVSVRQLAERGEHSATLVLSSGGLSAATRSPDQCDLTAGHCQMSCLRILRRTFCKVPRKFRYSSSPTSSNICSSMRYSIGQIFSKADRPFAVMLTSRTRISSERG